MCAVVEYRTGLVNTYSNQLGRTSNKTPHQQTTGVKRKSKSISKTLDYKMAPQNSKTREKRSGNVFDTNEQRDYSV